MAAEEEVKIVLTAEERASREIERLTSKLNQFQSRIKSQFSKPVANSFFDDKKVSAAWKKYGEGMREAGEGHVRYARDMLRAGKLTAANYVEQERRVRALMNSELASSKVQQAKFVEAMQRLRGMQYALNRENERYQQQKRRELQIFDQVERAKDRLAGLGFVAEQRRRTILDSLDRQRSRAYLKSERDKVSATASLDRQRTQAFLRDLRETAQAQQSHQNYINRLKANSFAMEMRQKAVSERDEARARARQERDFRRSMGRGWQGAKDAVGGVRSGAQTAAVTSAVTLAGIEKIAEHGINSRMRIESAEANLRMFGGYDQKKVDETRRGWLDKEAVQKGFSPSSAINALTEVIKAGIPEASAKGVTQSIMGASAGLDLNVTETTKLVGRLSTLTQNPKDFHPDAISRMLNGIAVVAKVTAADSNELVSSLRRGAGVLGSTKMSVQDLTAFTGVGISAGMQEGKAGTFMDFLTNDLVNAKNSRGQRRTDLQQGLRLAGMGSLQSVSRQAANDPTSLLLKLFENMAKMNPMKAGQVATLIGMREWRGELLQMVKASPMLRPTIEAERDEKNGNHLQQAQDIQLGTLRGMMRQINATAELLWEAVGKGLEAPFREIGRFFLGFGQDFDPKIITDHISVLVEGLTTGLGFGSITDLLTAIFGKPGDFDFNSLGKWMLFGKGLGQGIREVVETLRAMIPAGGFDPKTLGRWAGEIGGFATAITAIGPAVSILASLTSAIGGLGTVLLGLTSGAALIAGLGGTGAAAKAGASALMANGPLMAAGNIIALGFLATVAKNFNVLQMDPKKGVLGSIAEEFVPAPLRRWLDSGAGETTGGIRAPDGTPGQRQSFRDVETTGSISGMIRKASLTSDDSYRAFDGGDRGVNRIADSVRDLRSMIQLAALTGGGIAGVGGSVSGGGGGGVFGAPGGGRFFKPDMQVPSWYGQGRGGPGYTGGSTAPRGNAAQNFASLSPRISADLQKDFGLDKESASAILGNLGHESAGMTAFQEGNPLRGGRGGWGWAQWTGPRRRQFEAWAAARNLDPKSYEANYGFLKHELSGSHRSSLDAVRNATGLEGKTVAFENSFENAHKDHKHYDRRIGYARQAMGLNGTQVASIDPSVGVNVPGLGLGKGQYDGLRLKGDQARAGGGTALGVTDLARQAQENLPGGVKHFGAFNDHYHQGTRSKHASGLAFDTTLNDARMSQQATEAMRQKMRAAGLDDSQFNVIDEYLNPSARSTGGHIHTQFNSQDAAKKYHDYIQSMGLKPKPEGVAAGKLPGADAVDIASTFDGMEEGKHRKELSKFMGHDVAGDVNAWCARFVNSSLEAAGMKSTKSPLASSYLKWGQEVTDKSQIKRGDVLVEDHRDDKSTPFKAGMQGGHANLATGRTKMEDGKLMAEVISGNRDNKVVTEWLDTTKAQVRRTMDAKVNAVVTSLKQTGAQAQRAQNGDAERLAPTKDRVDIGEGMKGVPLGAKPTTEEIVNRVPVGGGRNGGGGGGGGGRSGGNTFHVTQQIHGVTNSQEVANLSQRKMTEDWNHRTHDLEPELT